MRPGVTRANIVLTKGLAGDTMRIPLIDVLILRKSSFDRLLKEAQEKARTEEKVVTNRIISRLLDRTVQAKNPR